MLWFLPALQLVSILSRLPATSASSLPSPMPRYQLCHHSLSTKPPFLSSVVALVPIMCWVQRLSWQVTIITINITTDIYTDTNTNINMDSNNIETQRWALKGGEAAEGREWRWSWELFWKCESDQHEHWWHCYQDQERRWDLGGEAADLGWPNSWCWKQKLRKIDHIQLPIKKKNSMVPMQLLSNPPYQVENLKYLII